MWKMLKDDKTAEQDQAQVHEYELPGGWTVLVGKTEMDNDLLSLKVADPEDWWFHVRDMPGSHVILRAKSSEEPGRQTLKLAAAIAAYHSKARHKGVAPVACTRARYVRKPKRAKPGTVQIHNEMIFKVMPEQPVKKKRKKGQRGQGSEV